MAEFCETCRRPLSNYIPPEEEGEILHMTLPTSGVNFAGFDGPELFYPKSESFLARLRGWLGMRG